MSSNGRTRRRTSAKKTKQLSEINSEIPTLHVEEPEDDATKIALLESELSSAKAKIASLSKESKLTKDSLANYKKLVGNYELENAELERKIEELEKTKLTETKLQDDKLLDVVKAPDVKPAEEAKLEAAPREVRVVSSTPEKSERPVSASVPPELSDLPPALAAAVLQYRRTHEKEEYTVRSLKGNLRTIWFYRILLLGAGEAIAILLLTYSFIFIATFLQFGNTTSYFPWTWSAFYTRAGIVWNAFYLGIGISVATLAACMVAQLYIFQYKIRPLAVKPL
jgi:hypothetical protein